jgi:hypothetical protein
MATKTATTTADTSSLAQQAGTARVMDESRWRDDRSTKLLRCTRELIARCVDQCADFIMR